MASSPFAHFPGVKYQRQQQPQRHRMDPAITAVPIEVASSERTQVSTEPRTLVLCFDGTSNEYDIENTNVVKLFALLKKNDFDQQLCYYQPGVGTWFEPGVVSPLFHWGAKILDLALAWYLDAHVMEGYRFLVDNYRQGDKICVFGFSRGAYTARALAGFLYKAGLLPRGNQAQVPFAYKLYKREDKEGIKLCNGFKQTYSQDVKVEFMGVWDTVASVGFVMKRTLPFTNSNMSIKTFRHALALDERRVKFHPNYYHRASPSEIAAALDPEHGSYILKSRNASESSSGTATPLPGPGSDVDNDNDDRDEGRGKWYFFGRIPLKSQRTRVAIAAREAVMSMKNRYVPGAVQEKVVQREVDDVLEVWFAGCHSDVGGGSVPNTEKRNLSNISLRWMVREIVASGCGIRFDTEALAREGIELSVEPTFDQMVLNDMDAVEEIHDELKRRKLWWILEVVPMHLSWQDNQGVWRKKHRINRGKGRKILDAQPKLHVSVKKRMRSPLNYQPKARWTHGSEVYVY
ncbi:hypothetical protein DFP72DRAFT_875217 [Ephemerocybe angulata]|uniref:T6SS Phospholipase effector Tle1-like catalytic domain-containing protein n=1 Tax=Ephemerocybe angulata TaxID=980116 RepID=A0A8H6MCC6_9AGAR|nr:hypothetical protein DFP72DRAFT_875217 [Tulosesus angulatus]